ncbi:MAG TPA: hypothetical protein VF680_14920 [Allosphingosinicella sp.]|jgi:hypothetical protein
MKRIENMATNGNDGHGGAGKPAKSKMLWLIGLVLLALIVIIAIRAFVAGANDVTPANADKAPITETDQAIAGTKVENGSGQ